MQSGRCTLRVSRIHLGGCLGRSGNGRRRRVLRRLRQKSDLIPKGASPPLTNSPRQRNARNRRIRLRKIAPQRQKNRAGQQRLLGLHRKRRQAREKSAKLQKRKLRRQIERAAKRSKQGVPFASPTRQAVGVVGRKRVKEMPSTAAA